MAENLLKCKVGPWTNRGQERWIPDVFQNSRNKVGGEIQLRHWRKPHLFFYDREGTFQGSAADGVHGGHILGGAALHHAKDSNQFLEIIREAIGKFQLQDDLVLEAAFRVLHFRFHAGGQVGLRLDGAIQRDADLVIVADVGFSHVEDVHLWLGADVVGQLQKLLNGRHLFGIAAEEMGLIRELPVQQRSHRMLSHTATLLHNAVVHAAFDLKKDGGIRISAVIPQTQLVTVFVTVNCLPVQGQVVRIQVQAMDWIRIVRPADAILIKVQVTPYKIPH
jgi:hypothetical protein